MTSSVPIWASAPNLSTASSTEVAVAPPGSSLPLLTDNGIAESTVRHPLRCEMEDVAGIGSGDRLHQQTRMTICDAGDQGAEPDSGCLACSEGGAAYPFNISCSGAPMVAGEPARTEETC